MKKRPVTKEEKALWEAVNAASKRLHGSTATPPTDTTAPAPVVLPQISAKSLPRKRAVAKPLAVDDTTVMDKRNATRLRRGEFPLEGTLDLHGQTSITAHSNVVQFIERAYTAQKRCLLIITGKGKRSTEDGGILKKQLPIWLAQSGVQDKILALTPAQPKDGGSGAFYVLLRRQR